MSRIASLALALAIAGCTTGPTISTQGPAADVVSAVAATPLGRDVITDLQDAEWNLDQAIAINVLPASDPADACLHQALTVLNQEPGAAPPASGQSFQAKVTAPISVSAGSVAYIIAHQASAIPLTAPPACEQIVGHFIMTSVNAPSNGVIGAIQGLIK